MRPRSPGTTPSRLTARAFALVEAFLFAATVAACLLVGLGCHGAGGEQPVVVATLLEGHGTVEKGDPHDAWQSAAADTTFALGDAVRTAAQSEARLRVTNGGIVRLGESSVVRFRPGVLPGQSAPEIGVDQGQAEIGESNGLWVTSPAGRTHLEQGARVRVEASRAEARIAVLFGRAVISSSDGDVAVPAGEGLTVRIGGAIIERFHVKIGTAIVDRTPDLEAGGAGAREVSGAGGAGSSAGLGAPPPTEARAPATTQKAASVEGASARAIASPSVPASASASASPRPAADVTFTAGDSAVLHSDRLPLAIRLRTEALCPGDAVVEGAGKRAREAATGHGAVVLVLRAGAHPYRVRCVGDDPDARPRAQGTLTLKLDRGTVPLPRSAPTNTIDADGRRYTVLFQTRLPALTLVWAAPAGVNSVDLHVTSNDGEGAGDKPRTFRAVTPHHKLASGALAEGTHTWWYETADGTQSPKTTVTLRYDDTTPTAQFLRAAGASAPAGAIALAGIAAPGAKLSVEGRTVSVDERGHFETALAPSEGDDAVAVRVETPLGGARYYVRRREGSRP